MRGDGGFGVVLVEQGGEVVHRVAQEWIAGNIGDGGMRGLGILRVCEEAGGGEDEDVGWRVGFVVVGFAEDAGQSLFFFWAPGGRWGIG